MENVRRDGLSEGGREGGRWGGCKLQWGPPRDLSTVGE